jgi:hypothetical protein
MNGSSGILERIDWQTLVKHLDLNLTSLALPASADCPFCKASKKLTLYPDPFYKAQWYHCNQCKECGDLINLAAAVMDVPEKTAISNLLSKKIIPSSYNIDDTIKTYLNKNFESRKTHNKFWEEAKKSNLVYECSLIRETLRALNIPVPSSIEDWRSTMGQLVGFCTKRQAESGVEYLRSLVNANGDKTPENNAYRTFKGNWTNMLVIPFFDVPGRIREFKFLTFDNGGLKSTSRYLTHRKVALKYCSMAFFDTIYDKCANKDVVVVDDFIEGLKLHGKNFKETNQFLPLVAVSDIDSFDSLKAFTNNKFVYSNPKLSCETFKFYKTGNLLLSTKTPEPADSIIASKVKASAWLDSVIKSGRRCFDVLEEWLTTANQFEAEAAVGLLEMQPSDWVEVESGKYPNMSKYIKNLPTAVHKTAVVQGEEFFENEYGWFCKKNGIMVSAARVQVDTMSVNKGKIKCYGFIYIKDKPRIEFIDSQGQLHGNAYKYIEKTLAANGIFNHGLNRKYRHCLKDLAFSFSNPKMANESTTVGWCSVEGLFKFANFAISGAGTVTNYNCKFDRLPGFPTKDVYFEKAKFDQLKPLTVDSVTNRSIWTLAGCVVASALKPAMTDTAFRLFYYGNTSSMAKIVCDWFGITDTISPILRNSPLWPTLYPMGKRLKELKDFAAWAVFKRNVSCFTETTEIKANIIRLTHPCTVAHIELGNHIAWQATAAKRIFPDFLSWLLSTRGMNVPEHVDLPVYVLDAMKEWLLLKGCDTDILDKAKENIKLFDSNEPKNVVNAFLECCRYGLLNGQLSEGVNRPVVLRDNTACIDISKFMTILHSQKFNLADGLEIQPFLNTTLDEPVDSQQTEQYFVIGRQLWEEYMADLRHVPVIRIAR